jgi:hypothetical protein
MRGVFRRGLVHLDRAIEVENVGWGLSGLDCISRLGSRLRQGFLMRLKVLLMGGVLLRRLVHLDRPMVAEDGGSGLLSVDFISRLVRQGVLMRLGELTMGGRMGGRLGCRMRKVARAAAKSR